MQEEGFMGKVEWLKASAKKAYHYYRRNGLRAVISAISERLQQEAGAKYVYEMPSEEILTKQRAAALSWLNAPFLSVVVPAYETPEQYLMELLESMKRQTYPNWELVLADASSSEKVDRTLQRFLEENDQLSDRIRLIRLSENRGISHNTNEAILAAKGEYIGLLDHDDFLTPDALYEMALAVKESKKNGITPVFLYSDEDKCDGEGKVFYEPHLKLDFNPDMLLTNNYICHFTMMEAATMKMLLLRPEFDGAQDFDLVLRAASGVFMGDCEFTTPVSEHAFVHIPKVLYHWRCHMDSTAANPESKRYAYEAGRRALENLAAVQNWQVEVRDTRHLGFYEMMWKSDLLQQRKDVGAVAHPLPVVKGKLISGIYDVQYAEELQSDCRNVENCAANVIMRYTGLKKGFGGYLHRAELAQNVDTADVRTMQVQPQYERELQAALQEIQNGGDPVSISMNFCEKIHKDGLRILWTPQDNR